MSNHNKLPQEIFNAPADSLAKLAALFPSAVKDGQLDIAASARNSANSRKSAQNATNSHGQQ